MIFSGAKYLATLPSWVHEGGYDAIKTRIADSSIRSTIKAQILSDVSEENWIRDFGFDHIFPLGFKDPTWASYKGLSLAEIARQRQADPWEVYFNLLLTDVSIAISIEHHSLSDVQEIMQHSFQMIANDATAINPDGPMGVDLVHPRTYGTFPEVLGTYVRRKKVLTIETAIYKMTGLPAATFGLSQRGVIKPSNFADLVLFDPVSIENQATYENPHVFPTGIFHVFVNGAHVIKKGVFQ